jgi:hypothetical protein
LHPNLDAHGYAHDIADIYSNMDTNSNAKLYSHRYANVDANLDPDSVPDNNL